MRRILTEKITQAIARGREEGLLTAAEPPAGLTVETPKITSHGDWATNAALVMAKGERKNPRQVAEILKDRIINGEGWIDRVELAGPGFINFTLSSAWWHHIVREIVRQGAAWGRSDADRGRKVQVEFVSANPTGPLHVGHGRGAAVGDAMARLLEATGNAVSREYYINDAGRQMQTLGRAVLYRYLQAAGREIEFAADLYQGEYIKDLAALLRELHGDKYMDMPEKEAVMEIYPWAAERIRTGIADDLERFGVRYDVWFSEQSLYDRNLVDETLVDLKARGHLYEEGGALWFRSTTFGDDKDRVLVKSSGDKTYFASDIAYHRDKFGRGFDLVIDLWGADHHGYVARMKNAVEAMGRDRSQLELVLVQLVSLSRGGHPVAMSTRAGEFVTLTEVLDEVGTDAARFIFLTRSADSGLEFDLELAKAQSADNPVYYVQYMHARIASVFRKALERGLDPLADGDIDLEALAEPEALDLMKHLAAFPDLVEGASRNLEPHRLTQYLTDLAKKFHPYYNKYRFLGDNPGDAAELRVSRARLFLARAVKQVTANGLALLGVTAPEEMRYQGGDAADGNTETRA